jgi:hypothetical protein
MKKALVARMLIFLKEAAVQIDQARLVAANAGDPYTLKTIEFLYREVMGEIRRLEILHASWSK